MREFLKIEARFGEGSKVMLTTPQLASLQRICDTFRKLLESNCTNYALYRCSLSSDGSTVFADIYGSDDDGNMAQLKFGVDIDTLKVYKSKIRVKEEDRIAVELRDLVMNIMKSIPFTVGMLDFPIEGKFKEGFVMGYRIEKGTSLIIVKDSLSNNYFLED